MTCPSKSSKFIHFDYKLFEIAIKRNVLVFSKAVGIIRKIRRREREKENDWQDFVIKQTFL